jgi:hypothetical protein
VADEYWDHRNKSHGYWGWRLEVYSLSACPCILPQPSLLGVI